MSPRMIWSPWVPLEGCWLGTRTPAEPGLYRIRRVGRDDLDYIGQTGLPLWQRLGMLRGVYAVDMPYRDPHTAGPALWALRHASGCSFEASVCSVVGDARQRKDLEALAIGLYRQERGRSPNMNFGRMPAGYRMSSGNNARLVAAGLRLRGGPWEDATASHVEGIAPMGPLDGDLQGPAWCGHAWSRWVPIGEVGTLLEPGSFGLYRIRAAGGAALLYVGEGKVRERLAAHLGKTTVSGNEQGLIFSALVGLECSWVLNNRWRSHQRLELENDLIAAQVLTVGEAPAAQFLG